MGEGGEEENEGRFEVPMQLFCQFLVGMLVKDKGLS